MKGHRKGDFTEAVVIKELKQRNIPVAIPFGDNERYDLVAEDSGQFIRLQVKTGWVSDGCVHFHGKSSHTNASGNVYELYEGDVDYFTIYCHELESLFLIRENAFDSSMQLRVEEPGVDQPTINWANEYEFDRQWPPSDNSSNNNDSKSQILEFLNSKDVDFVDVRTMDADYDILLRASNDELFRVVVRHASVTNGRLRYDSGNQQTAGEDEVDYVLLHSQEVDGLFLVDRSDYDRTISLRVEDPGQSDSSINWAEEYLFQECWPPEIS